MTGKGEAYFNDKYDYKVYGEQDKTYISKAIETPRSKYLKELEQKQKQAREKEIRDQRQKEIEYLKDLYVRRNYKLKELDAHEILHANRLCVIHQVFSLYDLIEEELRRRLTLKKLESKHRKRVN